MRLFNMMILDRRKLHLVPEREHLKKLLNFLDVDCVFDVGANSGQYASMLREFVKYRGRIISFEPIPSLCVSLRQAASSDPLWTIEELALGQQNGWVDFNVMVGNQFSSIGQPRHDEASNFLNTNRIQETIKVKSETLGSAYERLKNQYGFKRPFLKLDTQGFDVCIVESSPMAVKCFLGLQSELAIKKLYRESTDFRDALTVYDTLGFELSSLVPNNEGHFPRLLEIDCIMLNRNLDSLNFSSV